METIPYRTKDLNEAAFIWCQKGSELVKITPETEVGDKIPRIYYFQFNLEMSNADLHKLLLNLANERCTVEPQRFVKKQNNLRDQLHTVKRKYKR